MKRYIFIDAEYAYTCAAREGKIPYYKWIFGMFEKGCDQRIVNIYHVGDSKKKEGLCNLLFRLGADYNIVFDCMFASKTQIVGAAMAVDVMRYACEDDNDDNEWLFLTGDDYIIPIVTQLQKNEKRKISVCYFPIIFSRDLEKTCSGTDIHLVSMNNKYFIFPK